MSEETISRDQNRMHVLLDAKLGKDLFTVLMVRNNFWLTGSYLFRLKTREEEEIVIILWKQWTFSQLETPNFIPDRAYKSFND